MKKAKRRPSKKAQRVHNIHSSLNNNDEKKNPWGADRSRITFNGKQLSFVHIV